MSDVIVVALFSFAGTIIGSVSGILTSNRLVNYRIEQLEKKMDKHNSLIERMTKVETRLGIEKEGG
ncbi:MAG: hypothetical protein ACOX8S_11195 [Christensenellales bacterium]|jgi:SMC interacting uncharacterized protein involved in chromosome segregation